MSYFDDYVIDGEIWDTRGGITYRWVRYDIEDGEVYFYESFTGMDTEAEERITDQEEIEELMCDKIRKQIRNSKLGNILK